MFRGWLDPLEPFHLIQRLRRDPILSGKMAGKLRIQSTERIASAWSHTSGPPSHWWSIPRIQARTNALITGNPDTPYHRYVARKYLQSSRLLSSLSLGCGSGAKEISWAETERFSAMDAYDISPSRIQAAVEALQQTRFREVIHFRIGDAHKLVFPVEHYDAIIFDNALHHFSSLESLLVRVKNALRPGGLLIANEFIGPSRFQWSSQQLTAANDLLNQFPDKYKTRWDCEKPRETIRRPSKLAMWWSDPSEAVESSLILPLLAKHFDVLETKGYGGTILQLLFSGIGHHFVNPDEEGKRLLENAMSVEDELLQGGAIEHNFALIVAMKQR